MHIVSMESIDVQKDDMCSIIAKLVEAFRNDKYSNIFDFSYELGKLLTKRYGLAFSVSITDDDGIDFWTYENVFMENNVLSNANTKILIGKKDIITANIDLKKAYITGSIQKYPYYILSTKYSLLGIKDGSYVLNPHEFAAAILHEVGHAFNYVSYMVDSVKMATVIKTRTEDLVGRSREERIKLVNTSAEFAKLSSIEKEDIVSADKKDSISVIILKHMVEERAAQLGMNYYSQRANEQAADVFAIRNGAGKYIGTTLTKIICKPSAYDVWAADLLIGVLTAGLSVVVSAIFYNLLYEGDKYDDAGDRCLFAKRELINQLKHVKTTAERNRLLAEIAVYDEIYEVYKNPPKGLFYYIHYLTSSKFRASTKQTHTMKEIESMIDNDLYVAASKLKG